MSKGLHAAGRHPRGAAEEKGPESWRRRPPMRIMTAVTALVVAVSAASAATVLGATARPSHRTVLALDTASRTLLGTASPGGSSGPVRDLTTTTTSSTTTTTTSLPPPPQNPTVAAPASFGSQLISLYTEIDTAATAVPVPGQTSQLMSVANFTKEVNGLSASSLSDIYTAAVNTPGFNQLPSTFQQADAVAAEAVRTFHLTRADLAKAATAKARAAKRSRSRLQRPRLSPTALTNYQPTSPVLLYQAPTCPSGAPGINYGETSIFALQVAADVAAVAVEVIPGGLSIAFGNATIPDIARIIVAAIQLGVLITHDTFAYLQAVSNDCAATVAAAVAANTDNSAYQTYQQLTDVAGTANEIDTNLANLVNQDTTQFQQQLTLDIQQALSAPTGTVPMAAMELPKSLGGYLDSTPVGVNEVVTQTIQAMQTSGQPMNSNAVRNETLAEEAVAAGQYKQAFSYYQLAYSEAAS